MIKFSFYENPLRFKVGDTALIEQWDGTWRLFEWNNIRTDRTGDIPKNWIIA